MPVIRIGLSNAAGVRSYAVFSPEAEPIYRYALSRRWDAGKRLINYLMLNPSTATHLDNDPTVERCQRRAKKLGYDGFIVTNLFALRSTDPKGLKKVDDPVGPLNDANILAAAAEAELVICGWGLHGRHLDRGTAVLTTLRRRFAGKIHALHLTKEGLPGHPLFLGYDLQPFKLP